MRPTRYLNCVIPRRIVCQCSTVQLVLQRVFRKPAPMQHHTGLTEYIRGIVQWIRVEQDEISDLTAFDRPCVAGQKPRAIGRRALQRLKWCETRIRCASITDERGCGAWAATAAWKGL